MNRHSVRNWPEKGVYALATNVSEEESGARRRGISFEVVPADVVQPFLQPDSAPQNNDPRLQAALRAWQERRPGDRQFHRSKLPILGALENMGQLQVWFDDDALVEEYELQTWYFAVAGSMYDCILELPLDTEEESAQCVLEPVDETVQAVLNELYHVTDIGSAEQPVQFCLRRDMRFWSVNLLYVGAALCVGIREAVWEPYFKIWYAGPFVAFFDLGCASGSSSSSYQVRCIAHVAQTNKAKVLQILMNQPHKTIIFSHLDNDHTSICRSIKPAQYTSLFRYVDWYAPEGVSVTFQNIMNNVNTYGGTIHVIKNQNPPQPQTWLLNDNPRFHIGKIDAFPGNTPAERHPHHHGIYVRVDLLSGKQVLLAGDCTYCGIPQNEKQNITYLQACHHGGNYALSPVPQRGREREIPQPSPLNNKLICSANGFTYGHPDPVSLAEHYGRGWSTPAIVLRDVANGQYICQ